MKAKKAKNNTRIFILYYSYSKVATALLAIYISLLPCIQYTVSVENLGQFSANKNLPEF